MRSFIFLPILLFSSCAAMPQMFQSIEDIADDTAIKVEVSKEALQKNTNLTVTVDVINDDGKSK